MVILTRYQQFDFLVQVAGLIWLGGVIPMNFRAVAFSPLMLVVAGCGGSGGGGGTITPPPGSFTIGGQVTGLTGTGLVLEDNGGNDLPVQTSGSFAFTTQVASGGTYKVTVKKQPAGPTEICDVTNGMGVADGTVANVLVKCAPPSHAWAWMGGAEAISNPGVYGTKGTPAAGNTPGAREASVTWEDASGNAWLFGGVGYYAAGNPADYLGDLWEYSDGEWVWVSGANTADPLGSYGTKGVASATNAPPAREYAVSWTDASGNLWMFGGQGAAAGIGYTWFDDLWKYSGGEWTWVAGSSSANLSAVYGTQGTPGAANTPGGRLEAMNWIDGTGNLWVFGGQNVTIVGNGGSSRMQNDLWKFDGTEWTWVGGANTPLVAQPGNYGVMGTPSATNMPGARVVGMTWADDAGDLWLFGGYGVDSAGTTGSLNDLWKYSSGEWTWVGGSKLANDLGGWGTQGVASAANIPNARADARIWTDGKGTVWLFGGTGIDSAGNTGPLDDLWKYSGGQWTWMNGSHLSNQAAAYGSLGVPGAGTQPGGCASYAGWVDSAGSLWLFCGFGNDATGGVGQGYLNDLWRYEP